MELKHFCSQMQLSENIENILKGHWTQILQKWGGRLPEFVSEEYIKKYLPLLQIPDDEAEILHRARRVIKQCAECEAYSLYMFVLHYAAFVLFWGNTRDFQSPVWGEDEGIAALIAALSSAPLIAENCRRRGIPEHYAEDALQWIGGTVGIYKLAHNNIPGHSLLQLYALGYHVLGKMYRIGRFEYLIHRLPEWMPLIFRNNNGDLAVLAAPDMRYDAAGVMTQSQDGAESFIEEDGPFITGMPCSPDGLVRVNEKLTVDRREFKPVCSPWDIVPSFHIPAGLKMNWEDALASMKEAEDFFKRYFKRQIPMLVCRSWIFNPALEKYVPNGNMVRLRRETFVVPLISSSNTRRDGMFFAFGRDDVDPTQITAATSLQKVLQEIFRSEGTLRSGAVFVLCEDLERLGECYYRTQQKVL